MDTADAGLIDKHGNWLGSQTILATSIHDTFQKNTSVFDVIIRYLKLLNYKILDQ